MRRNKGEGTIWYNSKNKLWVIRYVIRDSNNQPIKKSLYSKTKEEAQEKLVEIMYQ